MRFKQVLPSVLTCVTLLLAACSDKIDKSLYVNFSADPEDQKLVAALEALPNTADVSAYTHLQLYSDRTEQDQLLYLRESLTDDSIRYLSIVCEERDHCVPYVVAALNEQLAKDRRRPDLTIVFLGSKESEKTVREAVEGMDSDFKWVEWPR